MKRVVWIAAVACAAGLAAEEPQPEPFRYNFNTRLFFDTGICQHGYAHVGVGGGGEGFLWRGLTFGGEVGYHRFVEDFGFGLASLDVGYHFVDRNKPKKVDPFVAFSPLGAAFAEGMVGSAAIGGGLNYWFKPKIGLRTEVRFAALGDCESLVIFRIGVTFR